MANIIEKVALYTSILDEIFINSSKTAIFDVNPASVNFVGTKTVKYPKIQLSGYRDYSETGAGFQDGDVTIEYGEHTLEIDRGISFSIGVMEDDETAFNAYRNVASQFVRNKEVPEIDAYRFSKIFQEVTDKGVAGQLVEQEITTANALLAFDNAEQFLSDIEAIDDISECTIFVSNDYYRLIKQSDEAKQRIANATVNMSTNIQRKFMSLDDAIMEKVPTARFQTAINLLDTAEGGFAKDAASHDINFMIIKTGVVQGIVKHKADRYFSPAVNQEKDAHKIQKRLHHDLVINDNKITGVYINYKPLPAAAAKATTK